MPSSRIRPLATAVVAPLHPALYLASRLMLLVVAPLAYPLSVSSHLCIGLPIVCSIFRLFASFQKTTLICHIFKEIKLMYILLSKSVLDCGIFFVCCSRNGIIPCQLKLKKMKFYTFEFALKIHHSMTEYSYSPQFIILL